MKKIMGSSFYELMEYGQSIEADIKKNDMAALELKVETKITEYVTVLFFQKNFMALSLALFLMMFSWIFIVVTALQGIDTKESPGLYFGLYMTLTMMYMLIYIGSVFLLARGITLGLKMIYYSFNFIVMTSGFFSLYYLYLFFFLNIFSTSDVVFSILITAPLYPSRLILNSNLIKTALTWTINERARLAYLKLFLKTFQSPRKKIKLRVG